MDDIIEATDQGKSTTLILLDFSKAFDTIGHSLLCAKLHYYCFSNELSALIRSYLSNRTQFVRLNDETSQSKSVIKGVPQGSILGPLLFMLYTMDLGRCVDNCSIHQFADDTQIYSSYTSEDAKRVFTCLNASLESISNYSMRHGLKLNPSKSAVINFGNTLSDLALDIVLDNVKIQSMETVKNLGIYIDKDLRFRAHVKHLIQKAFGALRALYKSKHILNKGLRKNLCETLVLSHANYADVVYGPCLDVRSSSRIQKIQNSCIRFICKVPRRDHISPKLVELKWLNMFNRRKLHIATFVHGVLERGSPHYLKEKLKRRELVHDLNTRNTHLLDIPRHKTTLFKRSFSYNAANVYNSVPHSIQVKSVLGFKKSYKQYLLKQLV